MDYVHFQRALPTRLKDMPSFQRKEALVDICNRSLAGFDPSRMTKTSCISILGLLSLHRSAFEAFIRDFADRYDFVILPGSRDGNFRIQEGIGKNPLIAKVTDRTVRQDPAVGTLNLVFIEPLTDSPGYNGFLPAGVCLFPDTIFFFYKKRINGASDLENELEHEIAHIRMERALDFNRVLMLYKLQCFKSASEGAPLMSIAEFYAFLSQILLEPTHLGNDLLAHFQGLENKDQHAIALNTLTSVLGLTPALSMLPRLFSHEYISAIDRRRNYLEWLKAQYGLPEYLRLIRGVDTDTVRTLTQFFGYPFELSFTDYTRGLAEERVLIPSGIAREIFDEFKKMIRARERFMRVVREFEAHPFVSG